MKQTAVEFIVEELNKSIGLTKFVDTCDEDYKQEILSIIEQAKAMEKEQIVDAFSEGTRMIDVNDEMSAMLNGFIYYGENYEQDKQG